MSESDILWIGLRAFLQKHTHAETSKEERAALRRTYSTLYQRAYKRRKRTEQKEFTIKLRPKEHYLIRDKAKKKGVSITRYITEIVRSHEGSGMNSGRMIDIESKMIDLLNFVDDECDQVTESIRKKLRTKIATLYDLIRIIEA